MLSKIITGALSGLEAALVIVETDDHKGLPALNMVGLASTTVKEAGERIRSAITNTGYVYPHKRITINFSPAATRKEGSHFDLPIAIGVLTSTGQIDSRRTKGHAFIGELSLDGSVNRVKGALPLVTGFKDNGIKSVILPEANLREASIVKGIDLFPVRYLSQAIKLIQSDKKIAPFKPCDNASTAEIEAFDEDYADVRGQEHIKRLMVICAAGFHGLLMVGSPGVGKSMMARRLPTIMPEMSESEILESTQIYSVAGRLSDKMPLISKRPFRAPYHTISPRALVGGGHSPGPGEISLAHGGVLFLDELLEFSRRNLELLRQPMEDGYITIARQGEHVTFPSKCVIVAACNPCPCGFRGDARHSCSCSERQVYSYMSKLSAPMLDRIDLQTAVYVAEHGCFTGEGGSESEYCKTSAQMKSEVEAAVAIQRNRYKNQGISYNAEMTPQMIKEYCRLDNDGEKLMKEAFEKLSLSARGYHKTLKVARTIADISQSDAVKSNHLAEALQYRHITGGLAR